MDGINGSGGTVLSSATLTARGTITASGMVQRGKKRRWREALKALARWGVIVNSLLDLAQRLVQWLPRLQEGLEQALRGFSAAVTRWKRTTTPAV